MYAIHTVCIVCVEWIADRWVWSDRRRTLRTSSLNADRLTVCMEWIADRWVCSDRHRTLRTSSLNADRHTVCVWNGLLTVECGLTGTEH